MKREQLLRAHIEAVRRVDGHEISMVGDVTERTPDPGDPGFASNEEADGAQ